MTDYERNHDKGVHRWIKAHIETVVFDGGIIIIVLLIVDIVLRLRK